MRQPSTVLESAPLASVRGLLETTNAVLVVAGNGRLVGILTRADLGKRADVEHGQPLTVGDVAVRNLVITEQVAAASGQSGALSEDALRARYTEQRDQLAETEIGYIAVADQATADAVLQQLTANPAGYPAQAAAHPSSITLPQLRAMPASQIPQQSADQVAAAKPGTGFTFADPQIGVLVVFVGRRVVPTFEQARPQLLAEAESSLDQQGTKLIDAVRKDLHVSVNPRYGTFQGGRLQTPTGGVVKILAAAAGSGTSGN